ncbi:hypothetical protein VSR01_16490 [Actinacidiphila sp. DG2A-62]|uniref:hypothetical protein n=1 Tax=Actinacidiphila sp. DG2A-62 TaxID=3108821 RepID=UPI002DB6D3FB|nr:hypothetical protein [Actinacidiphila sp. DG2A-62]MEC3995045.1 hypothetical protein [Actinacidiphila sp. DG2A-62]
MSAASPNRPRPIRQVATAAIEAAVPLVSTLRALAARRCAAVAGALVPLFHRPTHPKES